MASQMIMTKTVWMLAIATIFFLPLQSHPSPKVDLKQHPALKTIGQSDDSSNNSPGMRHLVWWRWGGGDEDETEPTTVTPLTTTKSSVLIITETTTKKPSRWRSWFSAAKDSVKDAAKIVGTGMSVVGNATKKGFIGAGRIIKTGAKKVGNATIKAGRAIKRGFQKIRLKFSGSGEKFKIVTNRLKEKLESGDERALALMKKLGIHINFSGKNISGSYVENKNISVTEVLREEGMLSNKSSSYHTVVEKPEVIKPLDTSEIISGSNGTEFHSAEEYDEFHSGEEYVDPRFSTQPQRNMTFKPSAPTPTEPASVRVMPDETSTKLVLETKDDTSLSTSTMWTLDTTDRANSTLLASTTAKTLPTAITTLPSTNNTNLPTSITTTFPHTFFSATNTSANTPTTYTNTNLPTTSTTTTPSPTSPTTHHLAISTTTIPPTTFTTTIPSTTSTTSPTTSKTTSIPTTTILPPTIKTTTTTTTTTLPTTTTTTTTTLPITTTTTTTTLPTTTTTTTLPTTTTTTTTTLPTTTHIRPSESSRVPADEEDTDTPFPNISENGGTIVEEGPYIPPPFPDVFNDIEVQDRLREFYDNGDFSHAEMANLFNFDPDNYEYYDYNYDYEDYV